MPTALPLSPFVSEPSEPRFVLDEEAFLAEIDPLPIFLNNPTSRTVPTLSRDEALYRFWRAERDAGADPVTATERMDAFAAKHLDPYERDLEILRQLLARKV